MTHFQDSDRQRAALRLDTPFTCFIRGKEPKTKSLMFSGLSHPPSISTALALHPPNLASYPQRTDPAVDVSI
jgi:hypothetical protein